MHKHAHAYYWTHITILLQIDSFYYCLLCHFLDFFFPPFIFYMCFCFKQQTLFFSLFEQQSFCLPSVLSHMVFDDGNKRKRTPKSKQKSRLFHLMFYALVICHFLLSPLWTNTRTCTAHIRIHSYTNIHSYDFIKYMLECILWYGKSLVHFIFVYLTCEFYLFVCSYSIDIDRFRFIAWGTSVWVFWKLYFMSIWAIWMEWPVNFNRFGSSMY